MTPHKAGFCVWSSPITKSNSASNRFKHRFRWIVVLSVRSPKINMGLKFISFEKATKMSWIEWLSTGLGKYVNKKLVWIIVKIRQEVVKIWIFVFLSKQNSSADWEASVVNLNFFKGRFFLAKTNRWENSSCWIFNIINPHFKMRPKSLWNHTLI